MRLTNSFSVMGRKYDLAFGQANTWKRKLKNDKYELIENAIDKLGQYEDIEDEFCVYDNDDLRRRLILADKYGELSEKIGIDLITLFEALNNPIYIKENYDGTIVDETLWCSNCIICGIGSPIIKVGEYGVYPKDYRKTWALAKEELE